MCHEILYFLLCSSTCQPFSGQMITGVWDCYSFMQDIWLYVILFVFVIFLTQGRVHHSRIMKYQRQTKNWNATRLKSVMKTIPYQIRRLFPQEKSNDFRAKFYRYGINWAVCSTYNIMISKIFAWVSSISNQQIKRSSFCHCTTTILHLAEKFLQAF